ncbi:substrate-binding domain-containing protein [Microbacterium sp. Se63.02b]|uniref:substrate-binding domain-containing protein n=1 Tax=Microbacterium sp. Se63.02b TaxID=2709304 RepID=UPI001FCE6D49|nr:substrate-binding domain-containing protein [Microbacterium sp. Se63.02b]
MPTAVVAANDQMALGVLDVFRDAGIGVPDEVLVTGFDGIDAAALAHPPLTTVRQPMIDLGRAAVQVLARRLEHTDADPVVARLPLQILLRESSRRPS